jgi:hypothetical protein
LLSWRRTCGNWAAQADLTVVVPGNPDLADTLRVELHPFLHTMIEVLALRHQRVRDVEVMKNR